MENLVFQSKYLVFRIRNFEILGFSLEFKILRISSEIPIITHKISETNSSFRVK